MNRNDLAYLSYRYDGDWAKIANALKENPSGFSFRPKENFFTILDKEYPTCLKSLRYPPWVIYYRGDLSLLNKPMMTIVGARKMSNLGKRYTQEAVSILQKKYVIVSGLARGVDTCAHQQALQGGQTIGVIGSGFGTIYPKENEDLVHRMEKEGLLLSEYPFHVGVKKHHFPWRNRILAALGEGIIVSQAHKASGTMHTVNEALQLSKDIYVFPYPYGDENGSGSNLLLAEGAQIICDENVLKDL